MISSIHILKNAQPECTGVARIIHNFAKSSRSYGCEVTVLFLGDGPLEAEMAADGIATKVIPWRADRTDVAGAWNIWQWMRRQRAAIAHLHHGGVSLRLLGHLAGVDAVVQHIHGEILEPELESIGELDLRGANAVIACSRAAAGRLRQCRPELIYAGVEVGMEPPPPAPLDGPLRIGVLARLVPLKRIETVIEAAARLNALGMKTLVDIGGSGPSEAELRQVTASRNMESRVRFLGWQPSTASLLASWHALVMPSLHEGFPVAALEAMAAGRAVFGSRTGGLCEQVEDGVTGRLFPPGDLDALTQLLAEMHGDRQALARMGVAGWQRAKDLFSIETMTRQTIALYERLVPHGDASRRSRT